VGETGSTGRGAPECGCGGLRKTGAGCSVCKKRRVPDSCMLAHRLERTDSFSEVGQA